MPVINRIAEFHADMAAWRQDLHAHPELALQEVRTRGVVQDKLRSFGVDEIITGLARTGVVGVIRGQRRGRGDRPARRHGRAADPRGNRPPYASQTPGVMHACGHDGHTAMLLGRGEIPRRDAQLRRHRVRDLPARRGEPGRRRDHGEGRAVRALPDATWCSACTTGRPHRPARFLWRNGPMMAAVANIEITVTGKGSHGAHPDRGVDPIVVAAQIVTALQTIVARSHRAGGKRRGDRSAISAAATSTT